MVDFNIYDELHPENEYKLKARGERVKPLPDNDEPPQEPLIYLFPPSLPGFDFRYKKWGMQPKSKKIYWRIV